LKANANDFAEARQQRRNAKHEAEFVEGAPHVERKYTHNIHLFIIQLHQHDIEQRALRFVWCDRKWYRTATSKDASFGY
jgi:hypothetical protein